jgi:hypothetical protein
MTTDEILMAEFLADPALIDDATFARLWAHLGEPPLATVSFGNVRPGDQPWSRDPAAALALFRRRRSVAASDVDDRCTVSVEQRKLFSIALWATVLDWDDRWEDWLRGLFAAVPFAYAYACSTDEYDVHHMEERLTARGGAVYGHKGTAAQFPAFLPGIYWRNYFGAELTAVLPLAALDGLPGVTREALGGDRTVVALEGPPFADDLDARLALARQVAAQLGDDYFYDRERKERTLRTVATLEPLRARLGVKP